MTTSLGILISMSVQNILLHRMKSVVVGGILFVGSVILCTGLNLTRSVEKSMAESIQGSIGGDFQVYDSQAKDPLALFGGTFFGQDELGLIPDWHAAAKILESVPEVRSVVPMGFGNAFIGRGNDFDNLFEKLREICLSRIKAFQSSDVALTGRLDKALDDQITMIRTNLEILRRDLETERVISSSPESIESQIQNLQPVLVDSFWDTLKENTSIANAEFEDQLLYLDSQVAPIAGEKPPVYLRYMGTDIGRFTASFSRFEISEGRLPAQDEKNWILLPRRFYDREIKNIVAVDFDKLEDGIFLKGFDPKTDSQLTAIIAQLPEQALDLVYAIDPDDRQPIASELATRFALSPNLAFEDLIKAFLTMTPEQAAERTRYFQDHIAPKARLHEVKVGETLYVRAYTRTGFLKTLPLNVVGIYSFKGLDRSEAAGAISILSLESFRELYGVMSKQGRQELEELTKTVEVSGDRFATSSLGLEDTLFGEQSLESNTETGQDLPNDSENNNTSENIQELSAPDIDGLALNMAIVAKDREKASGLVNVLRDTIATNNLRLKVVDWKEASGIVGQLVTALNAILVISVIIILVVGVAIINNSLMMSTLERTREIGTLRAIGASQNFVTSLFLTEIVVLASIAVYGGAFVSLLINLWLNKVGIPAPNDFTVFLFSGPMLYPRIRPEETFAAASILMIFAVLSSAFPARFASRIQPAIAMQEKE